MTANPIRRLLDLAAHPERPCSDAHALAVAQLSEVEAKMRRLAGLAARCRALLNLGGRAPLLAGRTFPAQLIARRLEQTGGRLARAWSSASSSRIRLLGARRRRPAAEQEQMVPFFCQNDAN